MNELYITSLLASGAVILYLTFELAMANKERKHWQNMVNRLLDQRDGGKLP